MPDLNVAVRLLHIRAQGGDRPATPNGWVHPRTYARTLHYGEEDSAMRPCLVSGFPARLWTRLLGCQTRLLG